MGKCGEMKRALVLGGGGSKGAYEIGVWTVSYTHLDVYKRQLHRRLIPMHLLMIPAPMLLQRPMSPAWR